MSQQQIWVDVDTLQRVVGDANNDLARIVMRFAEEQDKELQIAKHHANEWRQKAEALHSMLRVNAQWVRDQQHSAKEYYPDNDSMREGYQIALVDAMANLETVGPL